MGRQDKFSSSYIQGLLKDEEGVFAAIDNIAGAFAVLEAIKDKSGKITDFIFKYINKSGAKDIQLQQDEIAGKKLSKILPKLKSTEIFRTFCKVSESGISQSIEARYSDTTGGRDINGKFDINIQKTSSGLALSWQEISKAIETERQYQDSILQLNEKNARLNKLNSILETEAKRLETILNNKDRIEKELSSKEYLLESILDSLPVGLWVLDEKGNTIQANKAAAEIWGEAQFKENKDHMEYEAYWYDTGKRVKADEWAGTRAVKNGESIFNEIVRIKTSEGIYKIMLNSAVPIYDKDKNIVGGIIVNQDITKIKETEEKLQRSRRNLMEAQRLAHVGSYELDVKTGNVEWTEETFRILEVDPKKGAPHLNDLSDRVHPEDQEKAGKTIQGIIENKIFMETEFRVVLNNNTVKYLHVTGSPSLDKKGEVTCVFGTVMDITDRKIDEQKLNELLKELERSNKELEQFAYVSSHDLQEPLRMITNFLKLLEINYRDVLDEKAKTYIDTAVNGAKRMSSLIKDLLTYSRVSTKAKPFEPTDLNAIVKEVTCDLQLAIKDANAEIKTDDLPVIKADPLQIKQLFQNLIQNAIKFNKGNPVIEIRKQKNYREWIFSIKDNGIGIAPEYFDKIFDIFQRLHDRNEYSGTGIGLTICKKIVEHHHGKIWLESQPGTGTTFYFSLPAIFSR